MSAFMCSALHFATVARAYAEGATLPRTACVVQLADGASVDLVDVITRDPARGVRLLAEQNAESIRHRYGDVVDVPDCSPVDGKAIPLAALRVALRCIAYQSCEHPGWVADGWDAAIDALVDAIDAPLLGLIGQSEFWDIQQ